MGAYGKSKALITEIKDLIKANHHQKDLAALQVFIELRFKTFNPVIEHYNNPQLKAE